VTFYSPVVVQSSDPSDNCLTFDSERRSLFSHSASLPWPFGTEPSYRAVARPGFKTLGIPSLVSITTSHLLPSPCVSFLSNSLAWLGHVTAPIGGRQCNHVPHGGGRGGCLRSQRVIGLVHENTEEDGAHTKAVQKGVLCQQQCRTVSSTSHLMMVHHSTTHLLLVSLAVTKRSSLHGEEYLSAENTVADEHRARHLGHLPRHPTHGNHPSPFTALSGTACTLRLM